MPADAQRVRVVDSHTEGEPTRVVISGGPDLGSGSLGDRVKVFREKYDWFRSAVVNEPRGSDAVVGALLCEPVDPKAAAAVIFFNNVSYLSMCGHGTIGVIATLAHLGRIGPGTHQLETVCGSVTAELNESGAVTVNNVPSYRKAHDVFVNVPRHGNVRGDVAWGGNWFFLVEDHGLELSLANLETLTEFSWAIRQALPRSGVSGDNGAEIDHIELIGPPQTPGANKRNFVLCPGKAYDRSPCGTGTSAKMACLYADGKLKPGDVWRQESIVGTVFEGRIRVDGNKVLPSITGRAFVTAESELILDPGDPFFAGIRPTSTTAAAKP